MGDYFRFLINHPTVVSATVAVCALTVSVCSLLLTACSLYFQRIHNYRTVRPIASIPVFDFENSIAVMLKNEGLGPLRVVQFRCTDGNETKDDLISWMPHLPDGLIWKHFYQRLDGSWLRSSEEIILLELAGDPEGDPRFSKARDSCRQALAKLKVSLSYEDIYERHMPNVEKNLDYFGRHWRALS